MSLLSVIIPAFNEPTCYKAFDANFLRSLAPKSDGFELEPEITAKALKRTSILEVPIKYFPRTYEEGKKIGWKDGLLALWTLFKYRFVGELKDERCLGYLLAIHRIFCSCVRQPGSKPLLCWLLLWTQLRREHPPQRALNYHVSVKD